MSQAFRIRIEPQWNVNKKRISIIEKVNSIRIEPQWNVNDEYTIYIALDELDQNRTIVKCKLFYKMEEFYMIILEQNHSGM